MVKEYFYNRVECALRNPMMGFVPRAEYVDGVGDNTLIYVDVTWRELEPEEGVYDFAKIAEDNYFKMWKAQGKKVVFRFVCDLPRREAHKDIPDWLYEKTGDGTIYDCEYGKGYSPNYANPLFIDYHKKAIEALGAEYGQDTFICYVQFGSLGHWGEWHVNYGAGIERFPSEEICRQYVEPYIAAFPKAKLMMRRPFSFVTEYGMGVFNDMTGEPVDTEEWLDWIHSGGVYDDASEPIVLTPCEGVWQTAPIGGEFTSGRSMEEMLVTEQARTIELLQRSYMTFIGPKTPMKNGEEKMWPEAVEEILKNVGYRYGVDHATISHDTLQGVLSVELVLKNYGVAPMYFAWPVCMYLLDEQGNLTERKVLDVDLTKLAKGQSIDIRVAWESRGLKNALPRIGIGIENPDTGKPEVLLDMDVKTQDKVYILNAD